MAKEVLAGQIEEERRWLEAFVKGGVFDLPALDRLTNAHDQILNEPESYWGRVDKFARETKLDFGKVLLSMFFGDVAAMFIDIGVVKLNQREEKAKQQSFECRSQYFLSVPKLDRLPVQTGICRSEQGLFKRVFGFY